MTDIVGSEASLFEFIGSIEVLENGVDLTTCWKVCSSNSPAICSKSALLQVHPAASPPSCKSTQRQDHSATSPLCSKSTLFSGLAGRNRRKLPKDSIAGLT
jgi:hypothetical protein